MEDGRKYKILWTMFNEGPHILHYSPVETLESPGLSFDEIRKKMIEWHLQQAENWKTMKEV